MIEVDRLTKHYGPLKAVDDVSFKVERGEILGFLGPNGAGKTTTMKMLSCFITPTSGTARIGGKDILSESMAVREMIGYLPESAPSYKNMTVVEFLKFIASVRGFNKGERDDKVKRIMETTFLDNAKHQTIDTLSKGYRQRVGFAQALIHDPPVLILDEPTDGLDPNQKQEVRTLIKKMSQEKAIILSTHILEEMEAVCTRAIIINQGKIVVDGSPSTLLFNSRMYNVISLTLNGPPEDSMLESLRQNEKIETIEVSESPNDDRLYTVRIFPVDKSDILPEVGDYLRRENLEFAEIYREKGYMDEVFRNLTLGEQV
ncbi:MAG: ABC transporter ATP-binding protein [Proteobacteria bacterium]|nr:ABC transporter ATP-binding protein [Pseudomonadota bacterium]